ncbi:MAG: antibiotic ABC transporter ATP-binding protein [Bacteroidetes bacterium CG_4_10_14_3_um_filter_31_20]|nr:MAG: antibiotic ABC transporter ATP-binding protein [Bacteroidetes bacterium CG_4_10_14_3_um_filter_31_20]
MKKFRRLFVYIKPYWGLAILNAIFNVLGAVFALFSLTMAIPFLGVLFDIQEPVRNKLPLAFNVESIQHNFNYFLTNQIDNHGKIAALLLVCVVVIMSSFFKNFCIFLANYFMAPIRNGVIRDIRNKLYNKILKLPLSYFSNERKGDILSRMSSDIQEVEWSIMSSIEMIFRDPLTILIYFFTLLFMSYELTLLVLVLLPLSGFVIGKIGKTLRKQSNQGQRRMGGILSVVEETLSGLRIIKGFNAEPKMKERFNSMNSFYTQLMIKIFRRRYLASPLSEFMGTIVLVIMMYYGGSMVLNDKSYLSPQEFIAYIIIFSQIINPAKAFSQAYYNIQKGMASLDRIEAVLFADDIIYEKAEPISVTEFKSCIEFINVSFKYKDEYVVKNVNLKIEKGKTIAFVGPSGAGKSTIADLIPRFFDVSDGDILIDGVSIKDYKISDLRNLMGIVTQQPILFNDTFYNNIAFGAINTTEEKIKDACIVANAYDFIKVYPNHLYTNIGDSGDKLSGGQKQRISIARAVLKNPPILILDEATSSLDTESERLVQDALTKLMNNRTSIVIAHRLSTIINADEIFVINNGEIVERGNHTELINLNGLYKRLHDIQNQHVSL